MTATDRATLQVAKSLSVVAPDGVTWTVAISRKGAYRGAAWWGHKQLAHLVSSVRLAVAQRPWIVTASCQGHSPYSSPDTKEFARTLHIAIEMADRIRRDGSPVPPRR